MPEPAVKVKQTYIYVISSPVYKSGYYKIGYHTGSKNKLIARYRTYLANLEIHAFLETNNHRLVESKIFEQLAKYRCQGNIRQSEIFNVKLKKALKVVNKCISEYGGIGHVEPASSRWCVIL